MTNEEVNFTKIPNSHIEKFEGSEVDAQNSAGFYQKLGYVATGFREDWQNNSAYGKSVQISAMVGQIAERARLSEITIAPMAAHILKETHNPNITALAVFGLVGAMQGAISHTWAEAMTKTPKTVNSVNTNFPKIVEYAEDIGMEKNKRRWYSNIREGAASFLSYGVTPFVVAEAINNPNITRKETHKIAAQMTGKCALFGYGIALGLSEVAIHSNPEVASNVINVAEKPLTWIGIAAAFEVPRLAIKRYRRSQELKHKK